ncbi:MAG: hypothetical protein QNJ51_06775 [Calothrix sp. MO_167.B12]|nr:hypothetical protein [Calothrix sp. MO_167.B12]
MTNSLRVISPLSHLYDELKMFLATSEIVDLQGNVYSWLNPQHPGYVYPEIMGFYLNLVSQLIYITRFSLTQMSPNRHRLDGDTSRCRKTEIAWLFPIENSSSKSRKSHRLKPNDTNTLLELRTHAISQQLQRLVQASGGLGKNGKVYVFDNCMAISGLLAYKKYLAGYVDDEILESMANFTVKLLEQRQICVAEDGSILKVTPHWSNTFGASMLKTVIALDGLTEETGNCTYRQLALEIAEEIIANCFDRSYFRAFPATNAVYCHAHCYALEGLLYLQTKGYKNVSEILQAGVKQLQIWQNDDGSLFNWYNTTSCHQLKVADATAQAIRLWLAIAPQTYADNITRGWQFLASIQSPEQGLYYHADSQDCNSWATMFALQALDWSLNDVCSDRLV